MDYIPWPKKRREAYKEARKRGMLRKMAEQIVDSIKTSIQFYDMLAEEMMLAACAMERWGCALSTYGALKEG